MRAGGQPSLQRHLWAWAAGALVMVWLTLAAAAWNSGRHEAREITDGKLISVARLLLAPQDQSSLDTPENRASHRRDYALELAVLRWEGGQLVEDTHGLASRLGLGMAPVPGLSSVEDAREPAAGQWRMYVASDGQGRTAAVLVHMTERDHLGAELAEHVVLPVLVILPVLMLVLWLAVRRGLWPLVRLSSDVAALDTHEGQRLDNDHRFREFASTVEAINRLVDSLQAQVMRERAFASDVAHELRTPLASLALGAVQARRAPTPEALAGIEQDALRAGRILQQLLDLARAERTLADAGAGADLGELAAAVAEGHVQPAYERGQALSLRRPDGPVPLPVSPTLLELALRNLVDNAIRHTPRGTQVRIDVWSDAMSAGVAVSDDGQRPGAFGATPSPDGLGLGLRLVGRVAARMGARLETGGAQAPMTTRYALVWPASPDRIRVT